MRGNAYRADIDGLRCVAVVSVLLSHLDLSWGAGGFVGVDVFFVISGFLITGIIARELSVGSYSILRFYERRARRILPALFVTLIVSFGLGAIALGPDQLVSLALSAVATVAFASNIWFWLTSSGYFGADVKLEPLLHTWSLGVEEQFYIFFPVLLWIVYRAAPRRLALVVAGLAGVSLVVAVRQVGSGDPQAAFYLLPSRIWELGLGALIALAPPPVPRGTGLRAGLAVLAFAAILVPVPLYTSATPFPGLAALPPVVGAAALIWLHGTGETPIKALLSSRPFVAIGLVSYSLYLWHWPVIVYTKVMLGPLTPAAAVACAVASLVLAVLSWRFVERPFRTGAGPLRTRSAVFVASGAGMAATAALAGLFWMGGGFAGRLDPATAAIFAGADDIEPRSLACMGRKNLGVDSCRIGAPGDGPADFLLWGDSHAGAAMPAFDRAARDAGMRGYLTAFPACAPLLGIYRVEMRVGLACAHFNDDVLEFLKDRSDIPIVILEARWGITAEGTVMPGESIAPAVLAEVDGRLPSGRTQDNFAIFDAALTRTVDAIRATGRRVVVMGDVPEIGWSVPQTAGQSAMHGTPMPATPTRADVDVRLARADASFRRLALEGKITYVPLTPAFCRDACDVLDTDRRPLYRDEDHLTQTGSIRRLVPVIERQLWPQVARPLATP